MNRFKWIVYFTLKCIPENFSNEKLLNILLFGSEEFDCNVNKEILKPTIKFLKIPKKNNNDVSLTLVEKKLLGLHKQVIYLKICKY